MGADVTADELLARALLAILRDRAGLTGRGGLEFLDNRADEDHLAQCPGATVTDVHGEDGACGNGTCNAALMTMTVSCPHVGSAYARYGRLGHLDALIEDMARIARDTERAGHPDDDPYWDLPDCRRCARVATLARMPDGSFWCADCARVTPGMYEPLEAAAM